MHTDVDSAVKAARRAYEKVWSKMPGRERGKYLYRIARIIQEKSRELAVLETMDGGKTIKESRDVDLPLVAAHFFYYAGWADKLKYAFPGQNAAAARRRGADHPVEFSAAHGRVENRARARVRQHRGFETGGNDFSITAMRLAQIFQEAELPEGVVNIVTGAGETGAALVNHPDVNKIAFTGSTEVGKTHRAEPSRARSKKLTLELGGKAANILFEDAPIDQAIEGVIAGIYFNQGHVCCAGSRLFVQEGIYSTVIKKLRDRIQTLARRQSARQKHRHRRDQFPAAAGKNPRAGAKRRGRRRGTRRSRSCALPAKGILVSADVSHRRDARRIAWRRRKFSGRC